MANFQNTPNEHTQTYAAFITMTKYATATIVLILILMAVFLLG